MITTDRTLTRIRNQIPKSDLPSADELRGWSSHLGLPFPAKDFQNRPKNTDKVAAWEAIKAEVAKLDSVAVAHLNALPHQVERPGDPAAMPEPRCITGSDDASARSEPAPASTDAETPDGVAVVPVAPESLTTSEPATGTGGTVGGHVEHGQQGDGHAIERDEPVPAPVQPVETEPVGTAVRASQHTRSGVEETWLVADLRPNDVNSKVFKQSLSAEGISELAADIAANGLRYPIDIMRDGTVLDGDRRRLAVIALGWTRVKVIVRSEVETAADIERYILRAYSTTRAATVEERANVYQLAKSVLAREHGRPAHRPEKGSLAGNSYWTKGEVWAAAAQRAGFTSFKVADRAVVVFERGSDELKALVNSGGQAVSSAYADLQRAASPKARSRTSKGKAGENASANPTMTDASTDGGTAGKSTGHASVQADESQAVVADAPVVFVPAAEEGGHRGDAQTAHQPASVAQATAPCDVAIVACAPAPAVTPAAAPAVAANAASPVVTGKASKVVVELREDQSADDVASRIRQLCAFVAPEAVCCTTSRHMLLEPARAALAESGYRYFLSAHGHDGGAHRYIVVAWRPGSEGKGAFDFAQALGFVPARWPRLDASSEVACRVSV